MKKFVFCYDISNQKTLNKAAKYLEKHGIRIQKSVFEIYTDKDSAYKIYQYLCSIVDKDNDRVFMYVLNKSSETAIGSFDTIDVI